MRTLEMLSVDIGGGRVISEEPTSSCREDLLMQLSSTQLPNTMLWIVDDAAAHSAATDK